MPIERLCLCLIALTAAATASGCGDDGGGGGGASGSGEIDDAIEDREERDDGDDEGDDDDDESDEPIEIAGTWHNVTLDVVETFSSTELSGDDFVPVEIAAYDNEHNTLVLRFEDEADPSLDIYTKVVWLEPDAAGFYYCPIAFELTSVEEAFAAPDTSDDSDVEGVGCDGGPWTQDVPVGD